MDSIFLPIQIGLLTNESAFRQYLQDIKSESILSVSERKKLFDMQYTHGMEMNSLLETYSSPNYN